MGIWFSSLRRRKAIHDKEILLRYTVFWQKQTLNPKIVGIFVILIQQQIEYFLNTYAVGVKKTNVVEDEV